MAEITIRNKELLATLNSFVDGMVNTEGYDDPKYHTMRDECDTTKGEYYCSKDYLDECLARTELVGVPDRYFASPISNMVRQDKDKWSDYMQRVKYDFAAEIGAHTSALLSYYPTGGFVGWHTNYDANAYQVLFTWSKTGDGYFKYLDNETGEIITEQDVKGWQARHYYFGAEDEPEHHCWHAAYAGCERITLAYKFVNDGGKANLCQDEMARTIRDMLIEDIESEEE